MTNIERAQRVIATACETGISDFCVCAGSRNSPLLAVLAHAEGIRLYTFVDERSAAFFALGRSKRDGRPVAVVTTSGTAVAELLPATVEAYYSGVPLLLITADRPERFRGTGAPQSIEQEAIFGAYAARDLATWNRTQPVHVNVEFDEPLIDAPVVPWTMSNRHYAPVLDGRDRLSSKLRFDFHRPLVLIGGLAPRHRNLARDFALRLNAPVYAEPLSGLREDPAIDNLLITAGERILTRGRFDGVIRIGSVPTLRFWRNLEESWRDLPVVHVSALPFSGLTRGEIHPIEALAEAAILPRERDERFFEHDGEMAERFGRILDDEPSSELAMLRALSRELAHGSRIFLGNSLPVREWDLIATREPRGYAIDANRGANGIDGQLSSFFGACDPAVENVAIVGDLTAMYDLNAPWIAPQIEARFRIIIINNAGGRIFSRVPSLRTLDSQTRERVIENVHELRFDPWAAMWGLRYGEQVVELRPDHESSQRAWRRYDELWG